MDPLRRIVLETARALGHDADTVQLERVVRQVQSGLGRSELAGEEVRIHIARQPMFERAERDRQIRAQAAAAALDFREAGRRFGLTERQVRRIATGR